METSPLKPLFGPLDGNSDLHDGSVEMYTNLGIGNVQSAMIHYGARNRVSEAKAYLTASEFYRHNPPYEESSYTIGVLPFNELLIGSELTDDQKSVIKET